MPVPRPGGLELRFDEVFALIRFRWRAIVCSILFCLALAAGYLALAPSQYTATTLLLIDPRPNVLPTQQLRAADANAESAYVETQVEVLRSERIARDVISSEQLERQPEFSKKGISLPSLPDPKGFFSSPKSEASAQTETAPKETVPAPSTSAESNVSPLAVKAFQLRLSVKRTAPTHIIAISFRHSDPKLAARIANSIASSYLKEQLRQREEIIRSTSLWLKQQSSELLAEAHAAETALLEFRGSNSVNDASSRIILRDLETTAQAYRSFSESFQKRFLETSQTRTFDLPDARVVSEAWPPLERSHPKTLLTIAIAGAAGMSLGFLIALARGKGDERSA